MHLEGVGRGWVVGGSSYTFSFPLLLRDFAKRLAIPSGLVPWDLAAVTLPTPSDLPQSGPTDGSSAHSVMLSLVGNPTNPLFGNHARKDPLVKGGTFPVPKTFVNVVSTSKGSFSLSEDRMSPAGRGHVASDVCWWAWVGMGGPWVGVGGRGVWGGCGWDVGEPWMGVGGPWVGVGGQWVGRG